MEITPRPVRSATYRYESSTHEPAATANGARVLIQIPDLNDELPSPPAPERFPRISINPKHVFAGVGSLVVVGAVLWMRSGDTSQPTAEQKPADWQVTSSPDSQLPGMPVDMTPPAVAGSSAGEIHPAFPPSGAAPPLFTASRPEQPQSDVQYGAGGPQVQQQVQPTMQHGAGPGFTWPPANSEMPAPGLQQPTDNLHYQRPATGSPAMNGALGSAPANSYPQTQYPATQYPEAQPQGPGPAAPFNMAAPAGQYGPSGQQFGHVQADATYPQSGSGWGGPPPQQQSTVPGPDHRLASRPDVQPSGSGAQYRPQQQPGVAQALGIISQPPAEPRYEHNGSRVY
jgi:hypothetical protein